jgi:hypothetical protein
MSLQKEGGSTVNHRPSLYLFAAGCPGQEIEQQSRPGWMFNYFQELRNSFDRFVF